MKIVYCAKSRQDEVVDKIEGTFLFASPNDTRVDHTASEVVIVGPHPHIAERYKGIAKVTQLDLSNPEPEDTEE
ncbi:MAG: hypothetical protein CL666_08650 [Balneola sp.]|nr:hypothetical protein [Balneola sp.]|tara:strand:+ start:20120 stop:20341 length:222 start_codon:yes stop_codon:yes gene_type:complete